MCAFCEKQQSIDIKIWDDEFDLSLWIDSPDNPSLLKVRLGKGAVGATRPIKINFCPYCGDSLERN